MRDGAATTSAAAPLVAARAAPRAPESPPPAPESANALPAATYAAPDVVDGGVTPAVAARWQEIVDVIAETAAVPAALIRVAAPKQLTVLAASRSPTNPYIPGERARRGGLYCEIVLDLGRHVVIPDATADAQLRRSAEREHGLSAYMGVPLSRPDGTLFGTLSILDRKPRVFENHLRHLLLVLRESIQADIAALSRPVEKSAEEMLRGQARVLEMIAAGAPLPVTLAQVTGLIEEQMADSICSILLLDDDGATVRHGAAPSLPREYVDAIDGIKIGPKVGSWGTAMYWGKPVVVSDIDTDPLWDDYRGLAVQHGLRACWSTPITSPEGKVLGAFANYWKAPRGPTMPETRLVEQAVHIAAIAIERKHVEAKIRANERRFRDYAETASDWLWESGPDYRFTFMSQGPAALRGAGRNPIGQTSWEFACDYDEDREKWDAHRAKLEAHEPFRDFVFRWQPVEGRICVVSAAGAPFFDAEGRFAGYRGTARDITEATRANKALIEAKEQAEIASKAKSEFLANMSHELRTPLNAIIGFADFIGQQPLGPLGHERYAEYVRDIGRSGTHLLEIINDMLDVARIEAGKAELREQTIRVGDIVGEVAKIMVRQIERAQLTLAVEIDPAAPAVRADARAMRQILLNLVSNAVKFTPEGGTITVRYQRLPGGDSNGVALSVTDTGIGIAAADIPKLMQPFAQVHDVYKRKYQGAGLGLTLVRSFAELHGGAVTIGSTPGRGTTVTVALPESRVVA